jgi:hypothetical protein
VKEGWSAGFYRIAHILATGTVCEDWAWDAGSKMSMAPGRTSMVQTWSVSADPLPGFEAGLWDGLRKPAGSPSS